MSPALYLFDDAQARGFEPFAATRPTGELRFGGFTARHRAEAVFGLQCAGHLCGRDLLGFDESGSAPALHGDADGRSGSRVLLCSRFVPAWNARLPEPSGVAVALVCNDRVAGWMVPAGEVIAEERLRHPTLARDEPSQSISGTWVESVWDLMYRSSGQTRIDIQAVHVADTPTEMPTLAEGVSRLGGDTLSIGEGVKIEPNVVLDVREGPIRLDEGVRVRSFTRLAGPSWIGAHTTLFGGSISGVSFGPHCKIRGEVEETVVLGFSNKAHDGFLGHAVLGRWVNLGAGTTNSDLKNNYGPVRLRQSAGTIDTGLTKVGCFLGDHVKTGIGTMLNTGTSIGAGSNVFGGLMPPAWVPAFSWGAGPDLTAFELDRFLEVAEIVMARRNVALTPGLRAVLERAWHNARADAP